MIKSESKSKSESESESDDSDSDSHRQIDRQTLTWLPAPERAQTLAGPSTVSQSPFIRLTLAVIYIPPSPPPWDCEQTTCCIVTWNDLYSCLVL
jgi:hypothetical protein